MSVEMLQSLIDRWEFACLLAVLYILPLALEVMITRGKSLFRSDGENARVTIAFYVTALLNTTCRFSL